MKTIQKIPFALAKEAVKIAIAQEKELDPIGNAKNINQLVDAIVDFLDLDIAEAQNFLIESLIENGKKETKTKKEKT